MPKLYDTREALDRILCLKLDHIGDLLIAAPALMMIRKSFPKSHITLGCAPWNIGLARRLRIADELISLTAFSQNSLDNSELSGRDLLRSKIMMEIQALVLEPFDLAIDFRRDEDTRDLLKLFDAKTFAGFGDFATFSYLGVALPYSRHGPADGASRLYIAPSDLNQHGRHTETTRGLHLTAEMGTVDLSVQTDQVWAPNEDGATDGRLLGTALWRIDVGQAGDGEQIGTMLELSRDAMQFGPGWLDWEPWGRWSSVRKTNITLSYPVRGDEECIALSVQGHTSPSHNPATVSVSAGGAAASHQFRAGDGPATLTISARPKVRPPVVSSEPFLLRGGRYRGVIRVFASSTADWVPLSLRFRTASLKQVIAKVRLPDAVSKVGDFDFAFEVEIKDSADPIVVEIEADRPDKALAVAIRAVEMDRMQGQLPVMPVTSMAQQLLDLAAMIVLRFSDRLALDNGETARRLSNARESSTATNSVKQLRDLRRRLTNPLFSWSKIHVPFIGIGIGANKETKRWSQANFVEIGKRLLERGCVLVLIGGPQEFAATEQLKSVLDAGDRVVNLCASCSIEDLGEVLASLDGFLGLDTGTTHFAGRVGLRTFAVFGASHDPLEWGPVGSASGWAAAEVACAGCSKSAVDQCRYELSCMTLLTPDQIWPAIYNTLLSPNGTISNLTIRDLANNANSQEAQPESCGDSSP